MDPSQVEAALEHADTVVSTTGVNPSRHPITAYSVVGAVLEVLTDEGTPSLPALIARQASLHRR